MIQIARSLVRTCRAVFKRIARREPAVATFEAGADGLRVRLHRTPIQAEYHQPGQYEQEVIGLPLAALADFEGRDGTVSLEAKEKNTIVATWQDNGFPKEVGYDGQDPDKLLTFPAAAEKLIPCEGLLQALADASATAAQDSARFAIEHIQLRANGEIHATDGKQLLVQSGFCFDWKEDVLIPASSVFACKELDGQVSIGRTDKHVVLAINHWNIHLPICKEGRFPRTDDVIPADRKVTTRCRITADDAAFLTRGLPRLPGLDEGDSPVTIDLNGHVIVRSKGEGQNRPTELILATSEVDGVPVRTRTNRCYLARAIQLGFTGLHVVNADTPILCQDDRRKYVWMALGKKGAIAPSEDALRIISTEAAPSPPTKERNKTAMNEPQPAESDQAPAKKQKPTGRQPAKSVSIGALIEEAQAIKGVLRDAFGRSSHLVAALKRQRKQSQILRSTLSSLKQLQHIGQ